MTVKGLTLVYIITNVHLFLSCILSLFVSYSKFIYCRIDNFFLYIIKFCTNFEVI